MKRHMSENLKLSSQQTHIEGKKPHRVGGETLQAQSWASQCGHHHDFNINRNPPQTFHTGSSRFPQIPSHILSVSRISKLDEDSHFQDSC